MIYFVSYNRCAFGFFILTLAGLLNADSLSKREQLAKALWVQQAQLIGSGFTQGSHQGKSVALSADGSTLAIGAFLYGSQISFGATWIFTKSANDTWVQQGPRLVGNGYQGASWQGYSVALSSNGDILAVGGPLDNRRIPAGPIGATWIFQQLDGKWEQQGPKLVGSGGSLTMSQHQGQSVAISADGKLLAVGAPSVNATGATWLFAQEETAWEQEALLVDKGADAAHWQGMAVAFSADGKTLAVGAPALVPSTYIFIRSGTNWIQQAKLASGQGGAVALSADRNTLAVGWPSSQDHRGTAGIFVRSEDQWKSQAKLIASDSKSLSQMGSSVALSADGNTLAAGGVGDNDRIGAVWMFRRSGEQWVQEGPKLVGSPAQAPSFQGTSVALSADGTVLAVGGPSYTTSNDGSGSTWIFVRE